MGVIADLIRAGVAPDLIEKVHDELVETAKSAAPMTSRQARNARYYQAKKERLKASESVLQDADKMDQDATEPSRADNNHASAPVISNGSSLRSEPELVKPLPSEGPLSSKAKKPKSDSEDRSALEIMSDCLPVEMAKDLLAHRKALRKPMTAGAAKALAKQFNDFGDPVAAAQAMMANGWQGFKPEYMQPNSRAGPKTRKRLHPTERMALGITNDAEEDAYFRSFQTPEPQDERSYPPPHNGPTIDLDAAVFGEPGDFDQGCLDEKPHRGNQPHETADLWGPRADRGGSR